MKIALSINTSWNVINFRSGLIKALLADGHEVVVITPVDGFEDRIRQLGCRHIKISIENHGTSPVKDFMVFTQYLKILRVEKPDAFLGYTIKPNIYGSLACNILGIPVINNISGLGTAFIRQNLLTSIVRALYKQGLKRSHHVFFQNDNDRSLFVDMGLVRKDKTGLLPGSGIDLEKFSSTENGTSGDQPATFLMVARLLWDKGVQEYVDAAKRVKQQHPNTRFQLLGFIDENNPNGVPKAKVDEWVADGVVEYLGSSDDVRREIKPSTCVVLPSYREGTPRTLLEAAAMGKPLIATDVPGCREVIDDGENGYLCEVKNGTSLAEACLKFLALSSQQQGALGQASRQLVENRFDEKLVIAAYLKALKGCKPAA